MAKFPFKKRSSHNDEIHLRTKYLDHSHRFSDWVASLGFQHTRFGRLLNYFDERFGVRRISAIFIVTLLLSFFIFADFEFSYDVRPGEVVGIDIKSPIKLTLVDEAATEAKREEAARTNPPVFDFDPEVYEHIYARIYKSFRTLRELARGVEWPKKESRREEKIKDFLQYKPTFENLLNIQISDRLFEWLVERQFNARIENLLIRALMQWSTYKIWSNPANVLRPDEMQVIIHRMTTKELSGEEFTVSRNEIHEIERVSQFTLNGVRGINLLPDRDQDNLLRLAHMLLVPNVTFNRQETAKRRQNLRDSILPVEVTIQKNQTILSGGSVAQPLQVQILREISKLKANRRTDMISFVAALFSVLFVMVLFSYLRTYSFQRFKIENKDLAILGMITLVMTVAVKTFLFMADTSLSTRFGAAFPSQALLFAAPIAAGPMLAGLLIASGELVLMFTIFVSVLLSIMLDMNFSVLVVSIVGGMAGARGVSGCKKRNDIYWAGLRTGLVSAATVLTVVILQRLGDEDFTQTLLFSTISGFLGGIISSLVAMMLVPAFESLFNVTTDIKLLELANLNHVLMKDMIVRAPGTYHHSLAVGAMVESAATEIGANALLGKVMAYYHDIGKMEHAQYFIENQRPGHNAHDQISPFMSKTILIAHVKDGAELGLKHKLGKPIIDGILQHHGTTLISYFYNKAIEGHNEALEHIDENDFRYPGPKPQFKEAALVMLADSIEAAARSLEDPTAARLTGIVKNIIQGKFLDNQLDECNLTLKDLSVIENAFCRTLLSIYHQRIDYPVAPTHQAPRVTSVYQSKKKSSGHSA